jgi:hypothetical protein
MDELKATMKFFRVRWVQAMPPDKQYQKLKIPHLAIKNPR